MTSSDPSEEPAKSSEPERPDLARPSRYELPDGWKFDVWPLTFGRGKIVVTDGTFVSDFW